MHNSLVRMILLGTAFLLVSFSASAEYGMVCNSPPTDACGEYAFGSEEDRNSFARQCKMGGGELLDQNCPAGPSCFQSEGSRKVRTFAYSVPADQVRAACEANGGTFVD